MIVGVAFFGGDFALLIFFLFAGLDLLRFRLFFQVSDMESFENRSDESFDLPDERSDGFGFGIEKENTA